MIIHEPNKIEAHSMELIEKELTVPISEEYKDIVKRVIHCTADFEYAETMTFSKGAVESALQALQNGCDIVTDTQMAAAGINKKAAAALGCSIHCYMSDADVAQTALKNGSTRAVASMDKAAALDKPTIFAIGNAPTALLRLRELIDAGALKPELIIGVPVGFVNILEAKEAILSADVPFIVAKGRKGGSNVAAAIVNSLMYRLTR